MQRRWPCTRGQSVHQRIDECLLLIQFCSSPIIFHSNSRYSNRAGYITCSNTTEDGLYASVAQVDTHIYEDLEFLVIVYCNELCLFSGGSLSGIGIENDDRKYFLCL